jgi:Co/Zn/Cd efflux system component
MAADAAVSARVVAAALLIWWTGWLWLDPAVSLAIVAVVVVSTWVCYGSPSISRWMPFRTASTMPRSRVT